jgi:hypothetical protein
MFTCSALSKRPWEKADLLPTKKLNILFNDGLTSNQTFFEME